MARLILEGDAVSPGIAMGHLIIAEGRVTDEQRFISEAEIVGELAAITQASARVCANLKKKLRRLPADHDDYRDMLETQIELARDSKILDGARARVAKRKICAAWALAETLDELIGLFNSLPEACGADRSQDMLAIKECLLSALANKKQGRSLNGVLAVRELRPADIMDLKNTSLEAIVTVEGGPTAHATILARSFRIPVISGLPRLFEEVINGEFVIVDGFRGRLLLEPDQLEVTRYLEAREHFARLEEEINTNAKSPARTRDGRRITVMANLESPAQIRQLGMCGAEGIGLYRTEFSYLSKPLPTEEDLYQEYKKILRNIGKRSVVFRALDVGADKILPEGMRLNEENPALGLRGIRFCLRHREIFETQLKALLRACVNANATLMLPMITNFEEVNETKKIIARLGAELDAAGIPRCGDLPLGIMLETPAAALIADELARHCDLLSIGTNDLLHYLLAIDRGNRHVASLHDPLHPAFLRILANIVKAAETHGKPVSVCGELASNPLGIILLIGLGINILSSTPRFVPALKYLVGQVSYQECREIVGQALNCFNPESMREKIQKLLANAGVASNTALMGNLAFELAWRLQKDEVA